ncbi:DUF5655 domain-containing protein [Lentilitoribacter sp. Alg239-R112]|uniref:DUF5655 domain-containing protein n=1 Tax=Lentilitoribacter sp. Alg239-R112 TaxID=2305987 RepID=UPI0013A68927|nr:DUF5655 domain-containing protein [Lentilitoribacter sp. Alg239-R112]
MNNKDATKIEKFFCNDCGQKTRHFIRSEHSTTSHDEYEVVSSTQRLLIIECCGCEHLALVKKTHFSEDVEYSYHPVTREEIIEPIWQETIYPPVTYRRPPPWFEDLPDDTLREISEEIYKSLQSESLYLATFGSRTLIDRLIVLTVGDQGNFRNGLRKLEDEGMLSVHESDILKPVLEAGNAAAHRGWSPNKDQIEIILNTVENLILRLLVLPKLSEELDDAVPSRNGKAKSKPKKPYVTIEKKINAAPISLRTVYDALAEKLRTLGADVTVHPKKHYMAFRRKRNFASVQIYNQNHVLKVYLSLDPDEVEIDGSFMRDVRKIGHFGTGNLEITIKSKKDIDKVYDLLEASYAAS